jgi:lipopolysaccharide biosynthesis protein
MCLKKYPHAIIMRTLNGCDTGAFLMQIKSMLASGKNYQYVFKIHTKSNNPVMTHWIDDLLDKTAGSVENVGEVIKSFKKHHHTGMIAGKKWVLRREITSDIFYQLCHRLHVITDGHFVGGTIFWVKYSIIKKFFRRVGLDAEYALCEQGKPSEPSYTHSWERIFGLIMRTMGYQIVGI